jgi:hypothetical protein
MRSVWDARARDGLLVISLMLMGAGVYSRGRYMLGIIGGLMVFMLIIFDKGKVVDDGIGPEDDCNRNAGDQER